MVFLVEVKVSLFFLWVIVKHVIVSFDNTGAALTPELCLVKFPVLMRVVATFANLRFLPFHHQNHRLEGRQNGGSQTAGLPPQSLYVCLK